MHRKYQKIGISKEDFEALREAKKGPVLPNRKLTELFEKYNAKGKKKNTIQQSRVTNRED